MAVTASRPASISSQLQMAAISLRGWFKTSSARTRKVWPGIRLEVKRRIRSWWKSQAAMQNWRNRSGGTFHYGNRDQASYIESCAVTGCRVR